MKKLTRSILCILIFTFALGIFAFAKDEVTLTLICDSPRVASEETKEKHTFPFGTHIDLSDYWPEEDDLKGFIGWRDKKEGDAKNYEHFVITEDTTLYGTWLVGGGVYTIEFDAMGGEIIPKKIRQMHGAYDRSIEYANTFCVPYREGYKFVGWSLYSYKHFVRGGSDDYLEDDSTYYAMWKKEERPTASLEQDDAIIDFYAGENKKFDRVYSLEAPDTDLEIIGIHNIWNRGVEKTLVYDRERLISNQKIEEKVIEDIYKFSSESIGVLENAEWSMGDESIRLGDVIIIEDKNYLVYSEEKNGILVTELESGKVFSFADGKLTEIKKKNSALKNDPKLVIIENVAYVQKYVVNKQETTYFLYTLEGQPAGYYTLKMKGSAEAVFYEEYMPEVLSKTQFKAEDGVAKTKDGRYVFATRSGLHVFDLLYGKDVSALGSGKKRVDEACGNITVKLPKSNSDKEAFIVNSPGFREGYEFGFKSKTQSDEYDIYEIVASEIARICIFEYSEFEVTPKIIENKTEQEKEPVQEIVPIEWENPFDDVNEKDWFYSSVKNMSIKGLMNGVTENAFAPSGNVNRAMFVTVLYRMENSPETRESSFLDIPKGAYYENAVSWASENGLVTGISDTEFSPQSNISREQMATVIYRYLKYKGIEVEDENDNLLSFNDSQDISPYARQAMNYAVGSGIIGGKGAGVLDAKAGATRAETAAILTRLIEGFVSFD